jgi:hypothetical protein
MLAPQVRQPSPQVEKTPQLPCALTISDNALSMGLLNIGMRGSGKTTLLSLLALLLLRKGKPQVIIDPLGTLTDSFLFLLLRSLQRVPSEKHAAIWRKLRYIDVGSTDMVTPFPIYVHRDGESLWEVSNRLLHVLELSYPILKTQSSVTWPKARRVADNAGAVLAALSFQLTEVEDLFFNTLEWEQAGRFAKAIARCPEAAPAVSYFRDEYLPLRRSEKLQLTGTFLDHVYRFSRHPGLRLLFGASMPGLDLEEVEERGETVILDFRNVSDPEVRRFALLWIFHYLYDHIKRRGRRHTILGLMIDEFAELTTSVTAGINQLAVLFDEFLQRYMRNHRIFFSCAFQSIKQMDEHLRHTLLSLGTQVIGKVATMDEARLLADVLFQTDPFRVKHWRRVWGTEPMFGFHHRVLGQINVVIDHEPEHMPLPEQLELAAQKLTNLGVFHFLTRPAIREGDVSHSVNPISIAGIVQDRKTGEYVTPVPELVERVRSRLAKRSGIPATKILQEQESRLRQRTPQKPPQTRTLPADEGRSRQRNSDGQLSTTPTGRQPEPNSARETQSHPTLDEQQRSFLTFISEHPDTPVSTLYKALGVSVWKGNELRDSLKAQGLLTEVALRTGKTTAGRPAKFVLLTLQAYTLFGIQPPTGRGGVIHRHLQQLITAGATAKGYTAQCEKELANGAIVDVHLANGQQKIAVEIAVVSTPEREITHIRNCLAVGYDQVYALFADENLLAQTVTKIQAAFSEQELEKVRLLPLKQLPHVG